jgi:hypothetical protein
MLDLHAVEKQYPLEIGMLDPAAAVTLILQQLARWVL